MKSRCSKCYDRKAKIASGPPNAVIAKGTNRGKTPNVIIASKNGTPSLRRLGFFFEKQDGARARLVTTIGQKITRQLAQKLFGCKMTLYFIPDATRSQCQPACAQAAGCMRSVCTRAAGEEEILSTQNQNVKKVKTCSL